MTEAIARGCVEVSERPAHLAAVPAKASPRYPGCTWYPAGSNLGSNGGPRSFAWHTAITNGGGVAIAGWVSQSDACQGFVERRGAFYQYKEFSEACYGTLDGNFNGVVTIESWDGLPVATATEDDVNRDAWPAEMAERIADIIAWAEDGLGIPIQRLHRTDSAGHGPHRTGISHPTTNLGNGNVYEGPGRWSSSTSKPCCGDKRLLQLYGDDMSGNGPIMQRARVIRDGVRAGQFSFLPPGDVDLASALARGSGAPPSWWGWFAA